MPRLVARYPEGYIIAHICGRNVEALLKDTGINYDKWLVSWRAKRQEARGNPTRSAEILQSREYYRGKKVLTGGSGEPVQ